MSFGNWWRWLKSLPMSIGWFMWLLLLRPLLDLTYAMKDISPYAAPLNIVAVLTPVAVVVSFCSRTFPRRVHTIPDTLMGIWGAIIAVNVIMSMTFEISLFTLEIAFRVTLPVFVYFFLRHALRNKEDVVGFLTTFLYSTAVVFLMLLYEQFVTPLRETVHTRGFDRVEGLFADVNSYAFYISAALLIAGFFFIDAEGRVPFKKRALRLAAVGAMSMLALLTMHHAASWAVFAAVLLLLLFHSLRQGQAQTAALLIVLSVPAYMVLGDTITERVGSMYDRELSVLEGERDTNQAFHGRMTRWTRRLDEWQRMSPGAQLLGVSLDGVPQGGMVGAGIHNDYLRVLFSTGIIGLIVYIAFYVVVGVRTVRLPVASGFLVRAEIAVVMLYSVTVGVTTSIPLLNIAMAVMAYGATPHTPAPQLVLRSAPLARHRPRRLTTAPSTRTIVTRP